MKYLVFFLLAFSFWQTTSGQPSLNGLADSLSQNANEIILNEETTFRINRIDNSELKTTYTAAILNKYAEDKNHIVLYYDKFTQVSSAKVIVYNNEGKKIDSYALKDFQDWNAGGTNVASDARAKVFKVVNSNYPYFVEVEYTILYKGSMFYPSWQPQANEKESLIKASLTVESFLEEPFRFKSFNINNPLFESVNGHHIAKWQVDNKPAFEYEAFSHNTDLYSPSVYLAPNAFQMDGIPGAMKSWREFGMWIQQLNSNRNTLTEQDLIGVKTLAAEHQSSLEKVRAIYHYLQKNTRYVSIQLGIGGWQPFESGFVHSAKYGDCKALSFYMKSLLESVGISSYYTIIRGGKYSQEVLRDFPNAHFNHAVLTVPVENDTLWLECTSQTSPFGYMGKFTSDRDALMITENGGRLIHTKAYGVSENKQATNAELNVDKNGVTSASVKRIYKGLEIENDYFSQAVLLPKSDQVKWFYDYHSWGTFTVIDLQLSEISDEIVPTAELTSTLQMNGPAKINGQRLFFTPFTFTNLTNLKLSIAKRKYPIDIKYPYTQVDSIKVTFPEVYFSENKLEDVVLESKFGRYERRMVNTDGEMMFTRTFIMKKGSYPPSDYEDFKTFLGSVQKYDKQQLVLINRT
ncbi:DUF3857 domain-containing protein [Imperialibacter roseus]|uniref:DUF3857 domain-containing protein n=1 Tax=Imperialibacter roseus TaxID=1324217 RepID=A0ABZ0ITG7_9BACT|nr:DUF3857 domain-containing protein [Imperialibacter roseus]WOK07685.1 DUF3857 domain-containing protein [Imperialibacter roseus]